MEGMLPAWLHGALVRNGPGTFRGMNHLFDGYAMLVKVSFEDGHASVQQRQASHCSCSMHARLSWREVDTGQSMWCSPRQEAML